MNKKYLLKCLFIIFLLIPVVSFVLANVLFISYMYWFQNFDDMEMPVIDKNAKHIIILAHGLKDTTESWTAPLKKIFDNKKEEGVQIVTLDWNPYSQNTFRCSVDGRRIGKKVAEQLNASVELKAVHFIGHSCGSFVVFGLCEAVKDSRPDIAVQTTFLDPVAIYGGFFWNYGIERFGSCGDFSDAYIDIEDGVPGSNQLLPNTHTFNVTAVRKASGFDENPHVWPTVYYQNLVESGNVLEYRKDKSLGVTYPNNIMSEVRP